MKQITVSLVLGSGGARGMAHAGVIKWLGEHNYKIESISGCSMGAMVGGFYAAGKLDVFIEWLRKVDGIDLIKLLDFQGSGGFVSGDKIVSKMKKLVGDSLIEDLDIKFTAVAADINAEKEVWINKGSLLNAIRASTSLPLFFAPYIQDGRSLVDGGVLNPVPIAPTFRDNTDLTIAVNLGGKPQSQTALSKTKKEEDGMYAVANKSFEAMQSTIARMKLSAYPPDIEIEIPRDLCGIFEFDKVDEVIDYGYNLCEKIFNPRNT
ncbi:MAG: serine protease [Helicobacteraceae bacterium CG2_30_36_10]|nr:MAG: serine protease [Helicobacteraceae bacterium CG2_30_36_10]